MIKKLLRRHPVLLTSFSMATLLALFFVAQFTFSLIYWSAHREEQVRPWMTVKYVGKSWGLDMKVADIEAGLPKPDHPRTLTEIAAQRGVPVEEVILQVERAVTQLRANKQ